jgi:hypothetical protein
MWRRARLRDQMPHSMQQRWLAHAADSRGHMIICMPQR